MPKIFFRASIKIYLGICLHAYISMLLLYYCCWRSNFLEVLFKFTWFIRNCVFLHILILSISSTLYYTNSDNKLFDPIPLFLQILRPSSPPSNHCQYQHLTFINFIFTNNQCLLKEISRVQLHQPPAAAAAVYLAPLVLPVITMHTA